MTQENLFNDDKALHLAAKALLRDHSDTLFTLTSKMKSAAASELFNSEPEDKETRERCYNTVNAVALFEATLVSYAENDPTRQNMPEAGVTNSQPIN